MENGNCREGFKRKKRVIKLPLQSQSFPSKEPVSENWWSLYSNY